MPPRLSIRLRHQTASGEPIGAPDAPRRDLPAGSGQKARADDDRRDRRVAGLIPSWRSERSAARRSGRAGEEIKQLKRKRREPVLDPRRLQGGNEAPPLDRVKLPELQQIPGPSGGLVESYPSAFRRCDNNAGARIGKPARKASLRLPRQRSTRRGVRAAPKVEAQAQRSPQAPRGPPA